MQTIYLHEAENKDSIDPLLNRIVDAFNICVISRVQLNTDKPKYVVSVQTPTGQFMIHGSIESMDNWYSTIYKMVFCVNNHTIELQWGTADICTIKNCDSEAVEALYSLVGLKESYDSFAVNVDRIVYIFIDRLRRIGNMDINSMMPFSVRWTQS